MTRLLATLFLLSAAPALARHVSSATLSCPERCENSKNECGDVCNQYAGAKGAPMCKKGCAEGAKKCEDKCKGKKGH